MNDALSNSAAERDAFLAKAKDHLAKGDEQYRAARQAILDAKALDPKLSNRGVAKVIGRSHNWINKLLRWDGTDGSTPFAGPRDDKTDSDRLEPEAEPVRQPVLRNLDTVMMGEHVLVVGNSTQASAKLLALSHAGLPFLREAFGADGNVEEVGDGSGEMNVVVVTDPPYGQRKRGITNDDNADWGEVYKLLKPRGGFAFCAFWPPLFFEAEKGIRKAGGEPVEYLVLDKRRGRILAGDHVQNRLEAIIYFERNGEAPWPAGRRTASLLPESLILTQDLSGPAEKERRELGGGHPTPKPVGVMKKLIELATEPGDIVLDPFTGSGTTLIACQRTGRRFIGIELEPKWAETAVRNWKRETGQDAIVDRAFTSELISFTDLQKTPGWGAYEE